MTLAEIKSMLDETGYKVAYNHFEANIKPPYVVFNVAENSRSDDDGLYWIKSQDITIDLFTLKADEAVEGKIEIAIEKMTGTYEKTRYWTDGERLYQTIYTFSISRK